MSCGHAICDMYDLAWLEAIILVGGLALLHETGFWKWARRVLAEARDRDRPR